MHSIAGSPTVPIFLLSALLSSQQPSPVTGRVTGTIVEARTGARLVAVLVKVQSTGQQAFSDGDGRFEIANVPVGPQTLLVSVVGYGLVRRDVMVSDTEVADISIPVAEGASTYVEAHDPRRLAGTRRLDLPTGKRNSRSTCRRDNRSVSR